MKRFYLVMMVVGTVVPWAFFWQFFSQNGVDIGGFLGGVFVNGAAGGAGADLIISALVFWVWSYRDAQPRGIKNWWLIIPATLLVGLSLGMPLYLYMRENSHA